MRKKLLPLGRLFESAWYNPILKAVPMSMGILMSGNAGYAIAGNMSDNVVIVQQQTISVTGTVIDASGEPLVGVNIVEAGTVNGVISDFEGKFNIECEAQCYVEDLLYRIYCSKYIGKRAKEFDYNLTGRY